MPSGSCLCGDIKIQFPDGEATKALINCHCTDCQKRSGSPHTVNFLPKIDDVKFSTEPKKFVSKAASGKDVTTLFCPTCGSNIAHYSAALGGAMAFHVGVLDNYQHVKIPVSLELFTKNRWDVIPPVEGAKQEQTM